MVFGQVLVAQAQIEGLTIVSNDAQLNGYGVSLSGSDIAAGTIRYQILPNRC
jgi:hypothetical protein